MAQAWQILTGKELPAFFFWEKKNVYISASSVTIDLYIEGTVIKIQSTVKILPWKKKSLVMTMMASFPSNINIPAWSLFPPGQSHCSILKALCECLKCSLDIFPSARLFACIQVMCQPATSSTDGLISSEQRSKQLSWEEWACVCSVVESLYLKCQT